MFRRYNPYILIVGCLLFSTGLFGQSVNSPYFIKDFLYKDEVYRLEAARQDRLHKFVVSLESQRQSFDLVSLDDQYIFYKKLAKAIGNVQSASALNFLRKSNALNDTIAKVFTEAQTPTFRLTAEKQKMLSTMVTDLAKIKGCDSVFQNRASIESILDTTKIAADSVAIFFGTIKSNCQYPSTLLNESNMKELLKTSMSLFANVLRLNLVDRNDASLAGELVVPHKMILVCVEKKRSDNTEDGGESQYVIGSGSNEQYGNVVKNEDNNSIKDINKIRTGSLDETLLPQTEEDKALNIDDNPILTKYYSKNKERLDKAIRLESQLYIDNNSCKNPFDTLIIDSIQFEFEADKLQNIKVVGTISGEPEIFHNDYPVSFSTKLDGNVDNQLLSVRNIDGRSRTISSKHAYYFLYNLLLYTENYAPKDQVVVVKPESGGKVLLKEANSEILKTQIFTDLVGLNNNDPNGLLQLEFSKPIYLWAKVTPLGTFSRNHYLWFSQVEPVFTLAKLEDDDNELEALKLNDQSFVSYTDVVRFRRASVGADLTILEIGIPAWHSSISLKYRHHYSIVPIATQDSTGQSLTSTGNPDSTITVIDRKVNSHLTRELGPSVEWTILPSDKYQLSLSYTPSLFRFYSNDEDETVIPYKDRLTLEVAPEQVAQDNINKNEWYHTFQLLATVRLSKRGELFFRSRYHFLDSHPNQNFFQSQVGYSYFFFANNN